MLDQRCEARWKLEMVIKNMMAFLLCQSPDVTHSSWIAVLKIAETKNLGFRWTIFNWACNRSDHVCQSSDLHSWEWLLFDIGKVSPLVVASQVNRIIPRELFHQLTLGDENRKRKVTIKLYCWEMLGMLIIPDMCSRLSRKLDGTERVWRIFARSCDQAFANKIKLGVKKSQMSRTMCWTLCISA